MGVPRGGAVAGLVVLALLVIVVVVSGVRGMAIVEGRSMEPLFHTGDVVFLEKRGPSEIRPGDVVVYKSVSGKYIIHRVVMVYEAHDTYCYVVKGDNNPFPDPGMPPCPPYQGHRGIPYEAVRGVVASAWGVPLKVPYMGGLSLALRG